MKYSISTRYCPINPNVTIPHYLLSKNEPTKIKKNFTLQLKRNYIQQIWWPIEPINLSQSQQRSQTKIISHRNQQKWTNIWNEYIIQKFRLMKSQQKSMIIDIYKLSINQFKYKIRTSVAVLATIIFGEFQRLKCSWFSLNHTCESLKTICILFGEL